MLKHFSILLLFLSMQVYNVKSEDAFYFRSTIFSQDTQYFTHIVEKGQTVYSISRIYQVSVEAIHKLNPGSETGIKTGSSLKIPQETGSYVFHTIAPKETLYSVSKQYYMKGEDIMEANPSLSVETFTVGRIIRIPINKVTRPLEGSNENKKAKETNALLYSSQAGEKLKAINVSLLLPFSENDANSGQKKRFLEYYEGMLLALDSLKRNNISVNLLVRNIGYDTKLLSKVLKNEEILQSNLIIGGFTDEQIRMISIFSKETEIPYVIPFTSKSDEPLYNPYVFQINTPHSYLFSKTTDAFIQKYNKHSIIFVIDEKSDKQEFIQALQAELNNNGITYKRIVYGATFGKDIKNALQSGSPSVIVPCDPSPETLLRIITPLQNQKNLQVSLFGYPEWQRLGSDYYNSMFTLNASIYSVFYTDTSSPEVKNFYTKFRKWYAKNLLDSYPKYSILGFDTGMFFIKALHQYGTTFANNINDVKYNGIQTDFEFKRISNWGGFINTNMYIINFNPDFTITKVQQ